MWENILEEGEYQTLKKLLNGTISLWLCKEKLCRKVVPILEILEQNSKFYLQFWHWPGIQLWGKESALCFLSLGKRMAWQCCLSGHCYTVGMRDPGIKCQEQTQALSPPKMPAVENLCLMIVPVFTVLSSYQRRRGLLTWLNCYNHHFYLFPGGILGGSFNWVPLLNVNFSHYLVPDRISEISLIEF